MAIEPRRNGRLYYYRKERRGKRAVSVYVGAGELVEHAARLDRIEREEQAARTCRERAERERLDELHRRESERARDVRRIIAATLTAAGYRNHRGHWRKQRHAG